MADKPKEAPKEKPPEALNEGNYRSAARSLIDSASVMPLLPEFRITLYQASIKALERAIEFAQGNGDAQVPAG
jgi:hypothetical protein